MEEEDYYRNKLINDLNTDDNNEIKAYTTNLNKDLDAFNLIENLLYENNNNSISKKFILNNNLFNSLVNIKELIKDNENNNNKIEECDYKKWINWNMNWCKYDAFLFIYANMIMNNLKNKSKKNCIICFNKIGEILLNINETDKKLGFWIIIYKFNLNSIGILNDNNNPQILDSIIKQMNFVLNIQLIENVIYAHII